MIIIEALGLESVGPFESVKLKIEPGLTTIYGLNEASGKNAPNGNAVGKSLLLSSLKETVDDEPIVGERSDRIKVGKRAVQFINHAGKRILVRRTAKTQGEKIECFEDGKNQEIRRIGDAKEFISKHWPLTSTEYSTFVHLDSRAPHPLVMGTSAQRKEFFTEFFGLDKLDAERKLYNAKLRELRETRVAFDELLSQYKKTKERLLTDAERADMEKLRDSLGDVLESLQKRVTAVQGTIRLMQFGVSAKTQIETLMNAYGDVSREIIDQAVEDNAWELKDVDEKLTDSRAWDAYRRDNARYIEATNALSENANAFIKKHGREEAQKLAKNAASNAVRLAAEITSIDDRLDEIERSLRTAVVERVDAPAEDEQDLRVLQRTYEHHLEHAEKFGKGKCQTCGQPVTIKDPAIVHKKLDTIRRKLEQHEAAKKYAAVVARRRELKQEHAALVKTYDAAEAERKKALPVARLYKEIRDLPSKPAEFKGRKLETNVLEKMKADIIERRELLKFVAPHVDTIAEYLALTDEQMQAARDIETLSAKMHKAQEQFTQALTKLEVDSTIADQLVEMHARLKKMKVALKDEPYIKMLVDAYSDKNIKRLAVDAIGERLMTLVNSYAMRIFEEDFRFSFVWDSEVRLLVHRRKKGKKDDVTDVRKLSGAESVFFTLILTCALLNFVPAHKRCNVLILDEPSAHMSVHNTEILQNILKIVNTLIPSIVVITPKHTEYYEGARNYTIIKSKSGVATLKKGHPQDFLAR